MNLSKLKNAWLSPSGKIVIDHPDFDTTGAWHDNLARCIIKDMKKLDHVCLADDWVDENSNCGYCYEYLESIGWIRLHSFSGMEPTWWILEDITPTKKQEKVIVDWCNANNKKNVLEF